jgi:hypothetical protein
MCSKCITWPLTCQDGDQGLILPTFYEQLLRLQIPNAQKDEPSVFLALLGSVCTKAARKMLVKLTPDNGRIMSAPGSNFPAILHLNQITKSTKISFWHTRFTRDPSAL